MRTFHSPLSGVVNGVQITYDETEKIQEIKVQADDDLCDITDRLTDQQRGEVLDAVAVNLAEHGANVQINEEKR